MMEPVKYVVSLGKFGVDASYVKSDFYFLDDTVQEVKTQELFPDINDANYRIYYFSLNFEESFDLTKYKSFNIEKNEDVLIFRIHGNFHLTVDNKTLYTMSTSYLKEGVYVQNNTPVLAQGSMCGILIVGNNLKNNKDFEFPNKWSGFYTFKPSSKNYINLYKNEGFKFIQHDLCYKNNNAQTTFVNWDEYMFWNYPQFYNTSMSQSVNYLNQQKVNSINYFCVDGPGSAGLLGIPNISTSPEESADYFIDFIKQKFPSTKKIIFSGICKSGYIAVLFSHLTGNNSISFDFNTTMMNPLLQKNIYLKNESVTNYRNIDLFFSKKFNPEVNNNTIINLAYHDDICNLKYFTDNVPEQYWNAFNFYSNPNKGMHSFTAFERGLTNLNLEIAC